SEVCGLDEAWESEAFLDIPDRQSCGRRPRDGDELCRGYAGVAEEPFHHVLIHSDRRAEHPRADEGEIGEPEESLHRAVLAERSVQDGEDDVDRIDRS